jgi:predicted outer membrane repeat protein
VAVRNSATALNVDGHGHSITQTCANNGVLEQAGVGALAFQNVTITGGTSPGPAPPSDGGGGVLAAGDLSLTNATVTNNSAVGFGGGFRAKGATTLTNSVVSNNTSSNGGGGFWADGAITVTNSTISGNADTGTVGGGGFRAAFTSPTATVTNSTISGNSAGPDGIGGGGIAGALQTTVTNSTITGNTAGSYGGGGIVVGNNSTVKLVYTTVVANTTPAACVLATCGANVGGAGGQATLVSFGSVVALPQGGGTNCAQLGGTTSNGFNFSDDASCGFTAATDTQNGGNPNLGALANNGGPTQTRLPQPGSPLIDAVPLASCQADGAAGITTDQRGMTRPSGQGCDIGSVEVQQVPQTKDDCKKGGWQRFVDDQGVPFENQGDCVSFVATEGKNKANG